MDRDASEPAQGGFSPSAADTSLLSRTTPGTTPSTDPSTEPSTNPSAGWDPIPVNVVAYFLAAGTFFVTFNSWDIPALPYPLVGNLLAGSPDLVQVPVAQVDHVNSSVVLLLLWGMHFLRRFFEVLYVHVYRRSMSTMEAAGAVLYYCAFGVWNGWATNIFLDYFPPSGGIFALGILVFVVGSLGNCLCHVQLKRLRSRHVLTLGDVTPLQRQGQEKEGLAVPDGCLFARVSCPHYLFEVITWLGFAIAAFTLAAFVFLLASTVTVCVYARKHHQRYRRMFGDEFSSKRKAVIPFIF